MVLAGTALALSALAVPARADDPAFIVFEVGKFDFFDNVKSTSFNLEYRSSAKLWFLKPFAGLMVNTDSAVYGYGGLLVDIYLGRRLVLTGDTAVGAYSHGDSKVLGSVLEFRSGMELAYRFDNRARLGVGFHHISNASIGNQNPGTEILSVIFAWPLGSGSN
jgi:hypothetical protein